MEALLDLASRMYEFVVVDVGSAPTVAVHRTVLMHSDGVLTVTTPDRCAVLDVRSAMDALVELVGMERSRFMLVVNMWFEEAGLKRSDITRVAGLAEAGLVPWERTGAMLFAVNEGRPFVLSQLNTKDPQQKQVVEALAHVAEQVYPPMEVIWQNRGKGLPQQGKAMLGKLRRLVG